MAKKNYLSRGEQEIWSYIGEKEIIDNELIEDIFPDISTNKRRKLLHSLSKKGHIKRARKNLYYNPKALKNFYQLALRIREGYIGLSSALRYYNLIEYEDFTIFIITKNFQRKIKLEGTQYDIEFIPLKNLFTGYVKKEGLHISSIEKTFFDCFLKPKFIGYSNLTKALHEANIDWNKFLDFYKITKNDSICQRTGYILELMKKKTKLNVPFFIFEFLQKRVKNPVKLISSKNSSIFNKKWKIQDNIGEKNILSWLY